jgi:hypothetical protein
MYLVENVDDVAKLEEGDAQRWRRRTAPLAYVTQTTCRWMMRG